MKICIRHRRDGSAVIVVLALLAILLVYVTFNARTFDSLSRDLKILEKRQIQRLQASGSATNSLPLANKTVMPPSLPVTSRR